MGCGGFAFFFFARNGNPKSSDILLCLVVRSQALQIACILFYFIFIFINQMGTHWAFRFVAHNLCPYRARVRPRRSEKPDGYGVV